MKFNLRALAALTLAGAFSQSALADQWVTVTPASVETALDGAGSQYVSLAVSGGITNPAGCGSTDAYVSYTIPSSMLAVVLTAVSLGKSVNVYVSSSSCAASRPSFSHIMLQN